MARGKSGESSPDAASLALRIATMGLSVASAAMMATASQPACPGCGGVPAACQVSYKDYKSFRYSLAATVISVALQAAAAWLTARGRKDEGKAVKSAAELLDTAAKVLLYSSSALSFAVDDFGTCGRRVSGVCKCAGEFCRRVHGSGAVSMAAAVVLAASKYLDDVPVSTWFKGRGKKTATGCGRGCHCHH